MITPCCLMSCFLGGSGRTDNGTCLPTRLAVRVVLVVIVDLESALFACVIVAQG